MWVVNTGENITDYKYPTNIIFYRVDKPRIDILKGKREWVIITKNYTQPKFKKRFRLKDGYFNNKPELIIIVLTRLLSDKLNISDKLVLKYFLHINIGYEVNYYNDYFEVILMLYIILIMTYKYHNWLIVFIYVILCEGITSGQWRLIKYTFLNLHRICKFRRRMNKIMLKIGI